MAELKWSWQLPCNAESLWKPYCINDDSNAENGSEPILSINVYIGIDTMLNFDGDVYADVKCEQALSVDVVIIIGEETLSFVYTWRLRLHQRHSLTLHQAQMQRISLNPLLYVYVCIAIDTILNFNGDANPDK